MVRWLACLAVTALLYGIPVITALDAASQTLVTTNPETQNIKVKTELMEVRAVVVDAKGRIVENLGKEDFELLENDKPQEISFFSISEVVSERRAAGAEPGRQAPAGKPVPASQLQKWDAASLAGAPVRTTLLYVDNMHLSFSSLNRVKQALRRFLQERFTEQDMAAIVTTSQTLGIAQQFTRDRQILNYAIEQVRQGPIIRDSIFPAGLAAGVMADRIEAVRVAVDLMRGEQKIDCPCDLLRTMARNHAVQSLQEASSFRKAMVSTIRDSAEQMRALPGKRMIVIFSDGFTSYDNDSGLHQEQLQPAIDQAVRSGVVIYTIDAKGLQVPVTIDASKNRTRTDPDSYNRNPEKMPSRLASGSSPEMIAAAQSQEMENCKEAPFCPNDPNYCDPRCFIPAVGQTELYLNSAEREEQNGLAMLADQTGGKMYMNHNDLDVPLGQAFDANRFYYVLSYYLPAGGDYRYRTIKVRVRNHPEYKVGTARGYSIPDPALTADETAKTPQQKLLQTMRAPLPRTDIGVSALAEFVENESDDKQVSLTAYFNGNNFQYREKGARNSVELEVVYLIYDSSGKQVEGISAKVEGSLTADRLKQAQNAGYRFSRRLNLKPGVYQARIGVREEGTDRMGTASAWVEVPQIAPEKLEMSSLILDNPLAVDPSVKDGMDVSELEQIKIVQGIPLYARGDFCDYFFRIHRGANPAKRSELAVSMELLKGGKPVRQQALRSIPREEENSDGKGWFDFDGDIDLKGLDSGVYEIRITVKDVQSNKTMQRAAVIGIE